MTGALLALPGRELTLMPWVRFDDQYPIHRKVAGLSDAAFRLNSAAIFWCSRNGTDGFVPEEDLDQVCAQVRDPARFAAECVRRGTWHIAAYECASGDCPGPREGRGWVIHDYLYYQPTKDESEAAQKKRQEQKSSGGKLGNHRRWHEARGVTDPDCPWCGGDAPSVSDRYPIGGSDRSVIAPSRPVPSVADVSNQQSRRNARGEPPEDHDDVISSVRKQMKTTTGRTVGADEARRIAASIFGSAKRPVGNPAAYAAEAIRREPNPAVRWPAPRGKPEPHQPGLTMPLPGGRDAAPREPDTAGMPPREPDADPAEHWAAHARRMLAEKSREVS